MDNIEAWDRVSKFSKDADMIAFRAICLCLLDLRARREKYEEIVADQAREIADLRERVEKLRMGHTDLEACLEEDDTQQRVFGECLEKTDARVDALEKRMDAMDKPEQPDTLKTCETCKYYSAVGFVRPWCSAIDARADMTHPDCEWTLKTEQESGPDCLGRCDRHTGLHVINEFCSDWYKPAEHVYATCDHVWGDDDRCVKCAAPKAETLPADIPGFTITDVPFDRDAQIQSLVDDYSATWDRVVECLTWDELGDMERDEIKRSPSFPHTFGEDGTCRGDDWVEGDSEGDHCSMHYRDFLQAQYDDDHLNFVRWLARGTEEIP